MTKLTATELWDALDDATIDAEIESALAKTPEEHRRDLVAAGFNLDEVNAKADALFASLQPPAPVSAAGPWRRRAAVVVPIALALAAAVALVVEAGRPPPPVAHAPPPETSAERAVSLRREAGEACGQQKWQACLEDLDEARALDAAGDQAPEIQALWRAAAERR
ncbi:MAG TPA: hypothetical protein VK762_21130 [Polyangiaceae bacterium]|jgi:hypothetical protein|nr:hypothetical protein [Polyangiaceae bacterium]